MRAEDERASPAGRGPQHIPQRQRNSPRFRGRGWPPDPRDYCLSTTAKPAPQPGSLALSPHPWPPMRILRCDGLMTDADTPWPGGRRGGGLGCRSWQCPHLCGHLTQAPRTPSDQSLPPYPGPWGRQAGTQTTMWGCHGDARVSGSTEVTPGLTRSPGETIPSPPRPLTGPGPCGHPCGRQDGCGHSHRPREERLRGGCQPGSQSRCCPGLEPGLQMPVCLVATQPH